MISCTPTTNKLLWIILEELCYYALLSSKQMSTCGTHSNVETLKSIILHILNDLTCSGLSSKNSYLYAFCTCFACFHVVERPHYMFELRISHLKAQLKIYSLFLLELIDSPDIHLHNCDIKLHWSGFDDGDVMHIQHHRF